MNTQLDQKIKPIHERQRLFEFKFDCRPTPRHPSFMELQRVDFLLWIYGESINEATDRAKAFISLLPYDRAEQFTADEITDEKIAVNHYPAWQLERFVEARKHGINYGYFPVAQKPDGLPVGA